MSDDLTMNGPDHYREAERLLAHVERTPPSVDCTEALAVAQVHATLAQAAALMAERNMPSNQTAESRERLTLERDQARAERDEARAALAGAWDEGWDAGYGVGHEDAINPDAPGMQRHNPYPLAGGGDRG